MGTLISLKKKHQDAVAEMSEQIDQLSKMKAKIEKDKSNLLHEISDVRAATEEIGRSKASAEKSNKGLLGSLNDANKKVEEASLTLGDFENNKRKIAAENADLLKQLQELENQANMLAKLKVQLQTQLDEARRVADDEAKERAALLGKFKSAYEESILQLDDVRKENKVLSNEIKDIMDQISEGGRSIHEIDKIRKRLEAEKMELEAALSEAEGALEQEENKVLRCQLELTQVRQEIDRRMADKDEEFMCTKKNMTKGIENMQSAVETEGKAKAEALRMKKKLETDVLDLESNLERANAANADTQRSIKGYQLQLREAQTKLEDQQRAKEVAHDELINAERRANTNQNALEEARTLLEQADRARRMVEQELQDTNESLSDQTCTNQAIQGAKMKLESEIQTLQADCDEMAGEASLSEEKAQRAMIDAARLADELRSEQELAQSLEREKRLLEAQVKDMQARVDEAQTSALKGGKKAMTRMDTRIRELESELDAENRRNAASLKNLRKSERKIKELSYSQEEDRKNHERMQALIDQLQSKIKSYKKQIEEAEEIAALNLAKYRQVQTNLAGAQERADVNEQALAKAKARSRASYLAPM